VQRSTAGCSLLPDPQHGSSIRNVRQIPIRRSSEKQPRVTRLSEKASTLQLGGISCETPADLGSLLLSVNREGTCLYHVVNIVNVKRCDAQPRGILYYSIHSRASSHKVLQQPRSSRAMVSRAYPTSHLNPWKPTRRSIISSNVPLSPRPPRRRLLFPLTETKIRPCKSRRVLVTLRSVYSPHRGYILFFAHRVIVHGKFFIYPPLPRCAKH